MHTPPISATVGANGRVVSDGPERDHRWQLLRPKYPQFADTPSEEGAVRRLRLNGLIRRLPHTNRYVLTAEGIRIAVFYTKVYNRLLIPAHRRQPALGPPELRAALAAITRHVDDYATRARLPRAA